MPVFLGDRVKLVVLGGAFFLALAIESSAEGHSPTEQAKLHEM